MNDRDQLSFQSKTTETCVRALLISDEWNVTSVFVRCLISGSRRKVDIWRAKLEHSETPIDWILPLHISSIAFDTVTFLFSFLPSLSLTFYRISCFSKKCQAFQRCLSPYQFSPSLSLSSSSSTSLLLLFLLLLLLLRFSFEPLYISIQVIKNVVECFEKRKKNTPRRNPSKEREIRTRLMFLNDDRGWALLQS